MRIALFTTCLADAMFPQAVQAAVTIPECLGHQVCLPEGQVCCGQMHASTGYFKQTAKTTRNHVGTLSPVFDGEWDATVIPSDSYTGAARREQGLVVRHVGSTVLARKVEQIATHTYDLIELLIDALGTESVDVYFLHAVTYHPTRYSLRVVKIADRPYRLLKAVEALTPIDLPDVEACYGFGGTFSTKDPEVSATMLADKMSNVMSTRAKMLCAGGYSYLIHIGGDPSRVNSGVHIMRLAEVLASTKDAPFRDDTSFAPKHVQHTSNSQHTQAVAQ